MAQRRYFKELRMQQFRSLVQTRRHGSFTAAARELNLSRTSVWQQIRALEEDFGVELVVVVDHQPQLTGEGELLVNMLSPLVDEFDTLKDNFLSKINRVEQKLTVATTTSLLHYELDEPTAEFRKKCPEVSLSFIDRTSAAAAELLLQAKADLAVIGSIKGLTDEASLEIVPLLQCPFVLACRKNHPLAKKSKITVKELKDHPLIVPSVGTNGRMRIDSILEHAGVSEKLHVVLQSYNSAVMLAYAEKNLGAALLSLSPRLMALHNKELVFKDLSSVFGSEDVVLVKRKARFKSLQRPYVEEFANLVIKSIRSDRSLRQ
ncbi:MAG TPA: LysR family transcriptional regulator [Planctomycetota bacterium]|nr:LysR family transcriptional regulator [Planctomycetota bacterium]